jgi:hypothetical protein
MGYQGFIWTRSANKADCLLFSYVTHKDRGGTFVAKLSKHSAIFWLLRVTDLDGVLQESAYLPTARGTIPAEDFLLEEKGYTPKSVSWR